MSFPCSVTKQQMSCSWQNRASCRESWRENGTWGLPCEGGEAFRTSAKAGGGLRARPPFLGRRSLHEGTRCPNSR